MNPTISPTVWYGMPALRLENDNICVVIIPSLGAKIVSLFDKSCQHEWLVPPMRPLKQSSYAADFVSQDMSGWDEMMPTIVPCDWEGARLPDHGEVWSIPWTLKSTESNEIAIVLSVAGVVMPYRFTRSVGFSAPDSLEFRYSLINTGKTEFPTLWAAHPQFAADSQTRIILPAEVRQVVNVVDGDHSWGKAGDLCSWPEAITTSGETRRLDRVRPVENHSCQKFYVPPEQAVSWAALVHDGLGCQLRLDWSAVDNPYLGLWVDEGVYNSAPVAALEPSNGYYDSLERAVHNQKVIVLEPGQSKDWTVTLRFGKAE